MATRGKTTFQKRQKEMARKQKQQNKAERREQRKLGILIDEDRTPPQDPALPLSPESEGNDLEGAEQPAQNWRPATGGHNNA